VTEVHHIYSFKILRKNVRIALNWLGSMGSTA